MTEEVLSPLGEFTTPEQLNYYDPKLLPKFLCLYPQINAILALKQRNFFL